MHWGVSYKEAKNLCQYRGDPIYHGLVTALNEYGEVRIQFHVYTDGHDQMATSLKAFDKTTTDFGLPEVHLFLTDDPTRDKLFFPRMLESLQKQQELFDSNTTAQSEPSLPECSYDPDFTKIASATTEINRCIVAMRATLGGRKIVGFDMEWEAVFRRHGKAG